MRSWQYIAKVVYFYISSPFPPSRPNNSETAKMEQELLLKPSPTLSRTYIVCTFQPPSTEPTCPVRANFSLTRPGQMSLLDLSFTQAAKWVL